jgi:two-component system cell cycle response regulator DivK
MAEKHKYHKSATSDKIDPINTDEISTPESSSLSNSIPLKPAQQAVEQAVNVKLKSDGFNWAGYTILIVEDNYMSFRLIQLLLKKNLVNILHADNGQKAIDMVNKHPEINLVLMDILLPVMNGFEATRVIKKMRPNLPVIAQTANTMDDDRHQCFDSGCTDYITKPIVFATLLEMINNYIRETN